MFIIIQSFSTISSICSLGIGLEIVDLMVVYQIRGQDHLGGSPSTTVKNTVRGSAPGPRREGDEGGGLERRRVELE